MIALILALLEVNTLSCVLALLPRPAINLRVEMQTTALSIVLPILAIAAALTWPGSLQLVALPWFHLGELYVSAGLAIDAWSLTMIMLVTIIATIVHIYSWGYLENDPQRPRFFGLITFFCWMMLLLVLSSNLLTLFVGWEGVGVASFLLIGFWREKASARQASLQAFLANRLGDWAFLIGLLIVAGSAGSWDWPTVVASTDKLHWTALLLMSFGAMTKSAQLPMSFWLPGSMEGPTPISALIHAATMVTAGVYLLIRFEPLLATNPITQKVLLFVGCATVVFMSFRACSHPDIKRVIAYSTMAQLGYMMVAVALAHPEMALCHLWAHGFFKALLFLCAGGAIVAGHHDQRLKNLAGILRSSPLLTGCFLIGLLSLIGCPGFPGFYSKEVLIAQSEHASWPVFIALKLGALLTGIYSGRLLGWLLLCPKPINALKPITLPASMRYALVLLAAMTMLLIPFSLLKTMLFDFPWQATLAQVHFLNMAQEPLVLFVLVSFLLSMVVTYFRHRHPETLEKSPSPAALWDRKMLTATAWLYDSVQILRAIVERQWEKIIAQMSTSPLRWISSWVLVAHTSSLRRQMLMLFALIAIGAVMLEGGKVA